MTLNCALSQLTFPASDSHNTRQILFISCHNTIRSMAQASQRQWPTNVSSTRGAEEFSIFWTTFFGEPLDHPRVLEGVVGYRDSTTHGYGRLAWSLELEALESQPRAPGWRCLEVEAGTHALLGAPPARSSRHVRHPCPWGLVGTSQSRRSDSTTQVHGCAPHPRWWLSQVFNRRGDSMEMNSVIT